MDSRRSAGYGGEAEPRQEAVRTALARTVAAGAENWDRATMLPRLVAVGPEEIADLGREGRLAVFDRLARALRGERMRGRAGHWSYSLDRHIGLMQALAAERMDFERRYGSLAAARRDARRAQTCAAAVDPER